MLELRTSGIGSSGELAPIIQVAGVAALQENPFLDVEITPQFEIVGAAAAIIRKQSFFGCVITILEAAQDLRYFVGQRALGPMIANLLARGEDIMIWAYRYTEKVIFLARWLTAPFFLALVAGILLLICKSFIEFYEVLIHLRTATGKEVIVGILNLVDFALMANLILIVIYSGYQNFIRKSIFRNIRIGPKTSPRATLAVSS